MRKYPLYDNLSKDVNDIDLTITQKRILIKRIPKIDKYGHELIYALIRMYQYENKEENTSFTLPYNGEYKDDNVCFNIDKLPNKLKQILFKFSGIHVDKMKEEKEMLR